MNRLSTKERAMILRCLVDGNSIRGTVRITGASKNTISKLLSDIGEACEKFQDEALRDLDSKRIQCDEIWSFCYAKQKNVPEEFKGEEGYGDVWTWTAIDADTKLAVSYAVGERTADYAKMFISDIATRVKNRVQITTDGLNLYVDAVEDAFGAAVDYAQLVKHYGDQPREERRKYSPSRYAGATKKAVAGNPKREHISTSYVERQNLTMRMCMRRFTRLTNAFSKKIEKHRAAIALHFMYYNFCRVHQTLRVTPAMEAGVTDRVWEIEDVVGLLD